MDNTERIIELLEKDQNGSITAEEAKELESLTPSNGLGGATESQKDYIETLLDKLGADLSDYTTTEWADLDFDEASDLIDQLKNALYFSDDVTEANAWDD